MQRIGKYEVIRQLGAGAMGRVYLARDPALERLIAIKLLHPHAAQGDARKRLQDEAKALAALNHPGIVTIYEMGIHNNADFLAMEYLPGRSLRELLHGADLTRDRLVEINAKVAVAVAAAHHAGILHRDIKPENVVVTDADDVNVVDFGIARRLNEAAAPRQTVRRPATPIEHLESAIDAFMATVPVIQTLENTLATDAKNLSAGTHTVFGTPAYMAPEVLMGDESSAASDVYSLGVMLYECLAGRRPYEAPTLAMVMALVIDDTEQPKPLDDVLWPLVARMLARDPAARPTLDEVVAGLTQTSTPVAPARRWLVAALAAAAVALAVIGGLRVMTGDADQPTRPSNADPIPLVKATIVVEPIDSTIASYGARPPTGFALSDVLVTLLGKVQGITITPSGARELIQKLGLPAPTDAVDPVLTEADMKRAEKLLNAGYVVRGSIVETGGELRADLVLSDGEHSVPIKVTRNGAELAKLMDDLAERIAQAIAPGASLSRERDQALARQLAVIGTAKLGDNMFYDARPFLEQAVDADATLFDAWYALASVRSWMQAPEADVAQAIDQALRIAPDGLQKEILKGASLCLEQRYGPAIAQLQPLDGSRDLSNTEARDLLYYLGEAHFHFGHEKQGVAYFERAVALDRKFRPALIHPFLYALGRRDGATAHDLAVALGQGPAEMSRIEFSLGHYADLAGHASPSQSYARLVLGQPISGPALEADLSVLNRSLFRIARALEAGDDTVFHRELDAMWTNVHAGTGKVKEETYFVLAQLGDVLLCTQHTTELRQLVEFLTFNGKTRPGTGHRRLVILAAPLLGGSEPIDRSELTDREAQLADAVEAEMAGDHALAAQRFQQLIDEPTLSWSFPERVALLRNLRAVHRSKDAEAVCKELRRPAVFHFALLVARKQCSRS